MSCLFPEGWSGAPRWRCGGSHPKVVPSRPLTRTLPQPSWSAPPGRYSPMSSRHRSSAPHSWLLPARFRMHFSEREIGAAGCPPPLPHFRESSTLKMSTSLLWYVHSY